MELGAGDCCLADHFEIVREGGDAGQHRIEQRLGIRTPGKRFGQPLQLRLVVLEQHGFLGGEVPEKRALRDAGFLRELLHRDVAEALAGEPLQGHLPQRLMCSAVAQLVQVRPLAHTSHPITSGGLSVPTSFK